VHWLLDPDLGMAKGELKFVLAGERLSGEFHLVKIKPREGEVYVDGYYVGLVDEFDGMFQKLHIEPGAHRIEVRAAGFDPLVFEVKISPEHTTTYQGEMKKEK
jgi:hypothetical protein